MSEIPNDWKIDNNFNVVDIRTYYPPEDATLIEVNSRSNSDELKGSDAVDA